MKLLEHQIAVEMLMCHNPVGEVAGENLEETVEEMSEVQMEEVEKLSHKIQEDNQRII